MNACFIAMEEMCSLLRLIFELLFGLAILLPPTLLLMDFLLPVPVPCIRLRLHSHTCTCLHHYPYRHIRSSCLRIDCDYISIISLFSQLTVIGVALPFNN